MLRAAFAVTATLLLATLPAQDANGLVRGFDGAPVAGAVVAARAIGGGGGIEVLTDAAGRFAFACGTSLTSLSVQLEGVVVPLPLQQGAARDVAVSFATTAHTALRGSVLGPDGAPAGGAELFCRYGQGGTTTVTTDRNGAFVVRTGAPVHAIVVEPMGWDHTFAGPFEPAAPVTIDLRDDPRPWFALRGRVLEDDGPLAGALVLARLGGRQAVRVRTRADGGFTVWSHTPVRQLDVPEASLRRRGPFDATATAIDLAAREHRLVPFRGRFVDRAGRPIARALVFGVERRDANLRGVRCDTITDADGAFVVLLPRATPFVRVVRDDGHVGVAELPTDGTSVTVTAER